MDLTNRALGDRISTIEDEKETKARIISVAAMLFAMNGYGVVSMREIAKKANIRPSSIYNHFDGKEAVLEEILDQTISILNSYYKALNEAIQKATSFQEVVDNLFIEVREVTNEFIYYGLGTALSTQFIFEKARYLYYDLFLLEGKEVIQKQLEFAIKKDFVKPMETEGLAAFISCSVLTGNQLRIGSFNGYFQEFDFVNWYKQLESLILDYALSKAH